MSKKMLHPQTNQSFVQQTASINGPMFEQHNNTNNNNNNIDTKSNQDVNKNINKSNVSHTNNKGGGAGYGGNNNNSNNKRKMFANSPRKKLNSSNNNNNSNTTSNSNNTKNWNKNNGTKKKQHPSPEQASKSPTEENNKNPTGMTAVASQALPSTESSASLVTSTSQASNTKNLQLKSAGLLQAQYQNRLNQSQQTQQLLSPTASNQYSLEFLHYVGMRMSNAATVLRSNALSQINFNYHSPQANHFTNNYDELLKPTNQPNVEYQNGHYENMPVANGNENNPTVAYYNYYHQPNHHHNHSNNHHLGQNFHSNNNYQQHNRNFNQNMPGQHNKKSWNWNHNQNKKPNNVANNMNKNKNYSNMNSGHPNGPTSGYRKNYHHNNHNQLTASNPANDIDNQQNIHPNLVYVRDFMKNRSRGSTPSPKSTSPPPPPPTVAETETDDQAEAAIALKTESDDDNQKSTVVSASSSTSSLKSVDSVASHHHANSNLNEYESDSSHSSSYNSHQHTTTRVGRYITNNQRSTSSSGQSSPVIQFSNAPFDFPSVTPPVVASPTNSLTPTHQQQQMANDFYLRNNFFYASHTNLPMLSSPNGTSSNSQHYGSSSSLELMFPFSQSSSGHGSSNENLNQQNDGNKHKRNSGSGGRNSPTISTHSNHRVNRNVINNQNYMNSNYRRNYSNSSYRVQNFNESNSHLITPPDRFLAKAHLIETKKPPEALLNGSEWDALSQHVWDRFVGAQQSEETYRQKMNLWRFLYINIKKTMPRFGLYCVGSTISGFGSDSSDVDMCLVSRTASHLHPWIEAVLNLSEIEKFFHGTSSAVFEEFNLIQARVPILRFKFQQSIEVDLNYNNCVGIRNTHLLYCYSQMDWRLRPLVLVVKLWAQHHNINNAKNATISSYSLVLMVIHFLQCGVTPPILPCLHKMYPEKFMAILDISNIDMNEEIAPYETDNKQTLGELLVQFLEYYTNFDYSQYAISIRTASVLPVEECRHAKSYKNDRHSWNQLCIEEPFDLTNTARSVYDGDIFDRIKTIFATSWQMLRDTNDLSSIFDTPLFNPTAPVYQMQATS